MIFAGRRAGSLIALVGLGGLIQPACQTSSQPSSCDFQEQAAQPASPLTMLSTARLDRVGNGFLLIGSAPPLVRWAQVDERGTLGAEASAQLPPMTAGPWFAAAGRSAPGDTVLIAYGSASTGGMVDIQVMAVPVNGGTPVTTALGVKVPDPSSTGGAVVTMGSSRDGLRAGLAWTIPGQSLINVQLLGSDGRALGAPLMQPAGTAALLQVPCLSFINGKNNLAVGFLSQSATNDPNPSWTLVEVGDDGGLDHYVTFHLGTVDPTCPLSSATTGGYVTTWQNQLGSWIGVYDSTSNILTSHLFAGAVTFGGADVQPPLAGVGAVAGGDYVVVLAAPGAAEAWRVDAMGKVGTTPVTFPSNIGQMGQISTVSFGGAVYATYADYTSSSTVGTDGHRFFVKVTCF